MFSLFRRQPVFRDDTFRDLAAMLTDDNLNPTFHQELLHAEQLDYTLDSLKVLDDYLEAVYVDVPADETMMRLVLRAGAYVGEVIRRESQASEYHWTTYKDASRRSALLRSMGLQLGTAGVLWADADSMCFPLARICKFIENGREESLYVYASLLVSRNLSALLANAVSLRSESP